MCKSDGEDTMLGNSTLSLPILMLQCSKVNKLEREACQRGWKFSLLRGFKLIKLAQMFLWSHTPLESN